MGHIYSNSANAPKTAGNNFNEFCSFSLRHVSQKVKLHLKNTFGRRSFHFLKSAGFLYFSPHVSHVQSTVFSIFFI